MPYLVKREGRLTSPEQDVGPKSAKQSVALSCVYLLTKVRDGEFCFGSPFRQSCPFGKAFVFQPSARPPVAVCGNLNLKATQNSNAGNCIRQGLDFTGPGRRGDGCGCSRRTPGPTHGPGTRILLRGDGQLVRMRYLACRRRLESSKGWRTTS